jgi:hypothetical protein
MSTNQTEKLANKIIRTMIKAGLTPCQMLEVIELTKSKLEAWNNRQKVINFKDLQ